MYILNAACMGGAAHVCIHYINLQITVVHSGALHASSSRIMGVHNFFFPFLGLPVKDGEKMTFQSTEIDLDDSRHRSYIHT